jgi:hypothetical protein
MKHRDGVMRGFGYLAAVPKFLLSGFGWMITP